MRPTRPRRGEAEPAAARGATGSTGDARTPRVGEVVRPAPDAAWWRVALIVGSALAVAVGALGLIWILARPLTLLFAAVVLAAGLAPIVARLERWLPRALAVALTYLALVLIGSALGWLVVPSLAAQARDLVINIPGLVAQTRATIDHWDPSGSDQVLATIQDRLGRFAASLMALPLTIVASALEIVLVFIMSAYWLISGPALLRFTLSLTPTEHRKHIRTVLDDVSEAIGGFVRGEALTASVMAGLVFVGLNLIGVQYPMVLALLAGLGEIIPLVGPYIAAVPAVGVALLESPGQAVVVLVFYIVVQQFENNLLVPHVMRRQVGVPGVLALFALVVGQSLGGILGAIVAIPFAGMLRVVALDVAAPALREWSGAPPPEDDGAGENPDRPLEETERGMERGGRRHVLR